MVPEDTSNRLLINLTTTNMKKILTLIALLMLVGTMQAQHQVTKFLGIPVDGTKAEMKRKLVAKGFTPKGYGDNEYLEGEFNGRDVQLFIVTNHNKVYRIAVVDKDRTDETEIRIRYNNLISQFEANSRYETASAQPIDEDTDISYEMTCKNKNFQAVFVQSSGTQDTDIETLAKDIKVELAKKFTAEQLANPTTDEKIEIENIKSSAANKLAEQRTQSMLKRLVWFRIVEDSGEYVIAIYYDNGYNKANGEDL